MKKSILVILTIIMVIGYTVYAGEVDLDRKVSLQLEDIPLFTVLNMISANYNLNIVQSSLIDKEISIRLDEVPLKDALAAILSSNGYNYYFSGDIIVVKPIEMNAVGELTSRTIMLNYLSPSAAVNAVQNRLSSKGTIKILETPSTGQQADGIRASRIIITDLVEVVPVIETLIREIDIPERQVSIEVRMVEINMDSDKRIGISWPTNLTARLHDAADIAQETDGGTGTSALGFMGLSNGDWEWGRLSVEETQIIIDFLDQEGNAKLISNPHITTLNNHEAEIKVTTVIPIQTINRFSEGGSVQDIVSFQDEEIGITLKVTPHICDNDEIVLDVRPTVAEIIGYAGPAESQKPITSERSIFTRIRVADGETAVMGGLLRENKIETEQKIFLLGSIPIVGNLFKHKSIQKNTTDLMIMISPKIILN